MPAGCKKSGCVLEDGLIDRNDPTSDNSGDPDMEHKILSKIVALKERLALWKKRLEKSVYQKTIDFFFYSALYSLVSYSTIHVSTFQHVIIKIVPM